MTKNIGTADRVVRLIIGITLISIAFIVSSTSLRIILIAVALFTFYEALVGWCALYALLGKNTCPINFEEIDKNNEIKK